MINRIFPQMQKFSDTLFRIACTGMCSMESVEPLETLQRHLWWRNQTAYKDLLEWGRWVNWMRGACCAAPDMRHAG